MICNERWENSATVRVNGIRGASLDRAIRLEQPFALTNFDAHNAFLFWRSEFIRRRPLTQKSETIRDGPRFLPDAQCVIAIRANFRRQPLITNDGIAVPFDQSALGHERHELWVIQEVIDHCTNGCGGCVNRADSFKLLERRTRTRAAVDRDIVFPNGGQFPAQVARVHRSEDSWTASEKDRRQTEKSSLAHRAMIHAPSTSAIDTGC